jgi:hypothetical protein
MAESDPDLGAEAPTPRQRRTGRLAETPPIVRPPPFETLAADASDAEASAVDASAAETSPAETRAIEAAGIESPRGARGADATEVATGRALRSEGHLPGRRRVRRRATGRFHLSRRRQQMLVALVVAVVAAAAVAWFVGSTIEEPQAYVPGGATH